MLTFFTKQGANLHKSNKFYTEMLKRNNKAYAEYLEECLDQGIEYYAHKAVEDRDWIFQLDVLKHANIWQIFRNNDLNNHETILKLQHKSICIIPSELGNMTNLYSLDLSHNMLASVPKEIGNLVNLRILNLSCNNLTSVPKEIGNLSKLEDLHLCMNNIRTIPKEFGNLLKLQKLYSIMTQIETLPYEVGNLPHLISCNLLCCKNLTTLPVEFMKIIDNVCTDFCPKFQGIKSDFKN